MLATGEGVKVSCARVAVKALATCTTDMQTQIQSNSLYSPATSCPSSGESEKPDSRKEVFLCLRIDAVRARISTQGAPFVEFSAERRLWPARAEDIARNCGQDEKNGASTCVCSICLDDVLLSGSDEQAVVTACGHVFHGTCCFPSERLSVLSQGFWPCPSCRQIVTSAKVSYKDMLLDNSEIFPTTGIELGGLLQGNAVLQGLGQAQLSHPVIGSRPEPNADEACENIDDPASSASIFTSFVSSSIRTESAGWTPGILRGTVPVRFVSQYDTTAGTSAAAETRVPIRSNILPGSMELNSARVDEGRGEQGRRLTSGSGDRESVMGIRASCMPIKFGGKNSKAIRLLRMVQGFSPRIYRLSSAS